MPFGGVYRIPKIEVNTTDEERNEWDVPSLKDLYSFQNLRGFMNYTVIGSIDNTSFIVNILKLERAPVHSPSLKSTPCGVTTDNQLIYENPYGWKWTENSDGSLDLCWLIMPEVPVIAHAVAEEGTAITRTIIINGHSCVFIYFNNTKTIYFKTNEGIWSITGKNEKNVIKKAEELLI
ncbi:hypothetical protein [Sutcliffiella rhizosphaerae]|uniref:Uncharacterized protein n=1 Tax=Sutcliffiella rhizosphaerae TaxID=2880967 RepID=A0ABM8YMV6_9BACI|nr:hypothetical protein [Sutcliffiella rhizosphaerae]CAG9621290.1 hypothetical protein BACCIP111883_02062 [Sutcliffiella rhizosphaerae]